MVLVQLGWIVGSLFIVLFAVTASYAIYGVTTVCADILSKNPEWHCSFPNVAKYVGGTWLYLATVVTQNVTLVMVSTIFIVLGGGQFIALFEHSAGIKLLGGGGSDHATEVRNR